MGKRTTSASVKKVMAVLLGYQRRFLEDEARCRLVLKSRQVGFTRFCFTLGAVLDGLTTGERWYYLSAGERQAKEAIEDVQTHCRAIGAAADPLIEEEIKFDEHYFKVLEVRLPGGGRIIGLPANPSTVRGSRGNLILDEFAFHKDAAGIWRAAAPLATHGFKLWVGSTPAGKGGRFWQLWTDPKLGAVFSKHKVTIYDAVADGLPINLEELRLLIGDDDDWAQEYCCEFLDAALAWLTFELIDACTDEGASMELPEDFHPLAGGRLFKGIDIGRTRNLTVDCIAEEVGDVLWQRQCKALDNVPFDDQEAEFNSNMALMYRCCIDKGLMGMPLWEHLVKRWGDSKIEGVQFGPAVMEDMATHLRERYEQRRIRIPYDLELRRDLHSIKRKPQPGGGVRFAPDASESKKSHADRFWAQALAVRAASGAGFVAPEVTVVQRSQTRSFEQAFGRYTPELDDEDDEDELGGIA